MPVPLPLAIQAAGGLASGNVPNLVEHGFALGAEALRKLDPETERYVVTRIGDHLMLVGADRWYGQIPVLEKQGWKIFIEWEPLQS